LAGWLFRTLWADGEILGAECMMAKWPGGLMPTVHGCEKIASLQIFYLLQ
jgi:hypothetical protein